MKFDFSSKTGILVVKFAFATANLKIETLRMRRRFARVLFACEIRKLAYNRPFPSSLVPLFQNESTRETFHMKMSSACSFIFMQIKTIFIRMVSHVDSL